MKSLLFILFALILSSCSYINQGVVAAKLAKDKEAEVLKVSVCAMSIGAYHRINNETERRALDILCGGEWTRPVTVDDIKTLRELGNFLRSE